MESNCGVSQNKSKRCQICLQYDFDESREQLVDRGVNPETGKKLKKKEKREAATDLVAKRDPHSNIRQEVNQ